MVARRAASQRITEEQFAEAIRRLSPLPSPARHWEQAACLAKLKRSERHCNDPDIAAAADFLDALAGCKTCDEQAAVRRRWPEISRAHAIFQANDPSRWRLEAWLLHDLTDREIADRCGLTPEIVRVYANLFFAMRDYLCDPEELAQKMFGYAFALSFRNDELDRFWHYLGLTAPTAVVAQFIDAFHAAWQPVTPPTLSVYLGESAAVPLDVQALAASFLLPTNRRTAPAYFRTHLGLIEANRELDAVRKAEKINQLKRRMVEYTRRFLAGGSARRLPTLRRLPPRPPRAQAVVPSRKEQPFKPVPTMPTMKVSDAELAKAQEIDRLPLPAKFDVGLLRATSR